MLRGALVEEPEVTRGEWTSELPRLYWSLSIGCHASTVIKAIFGLRCSLQNRTIPLLKEISCFSAVEKVFPLTPPPESGRGQDRRRGKGHP